MKTFGNTNIAVVVVHFVVDAVYCTNNLNNVEQESKNIKHYLLAKD